MPRSPPSLPNCSAVAFTSSTAVQRSRKASRRSNSVPLATRHCRAGASLARRALYSPYVALNALSTRRSMRSVSHASGGSLVWRPSPATRAFSISELQIWRMSVTMRAGCA